MAVERARLAAVRCRKRLEWNQRDMQRFGRKPPPGKQAEAKKDSPDKDSKVKKASLGKSSKAGEKKKNSLDKTSKAGEKQGSLKKS